MRSKFKMNYSNLVNCTCGSFLALIISHLCIKTFNLMIALAANKSIMRSKFPNNALFWISISWSICKSQIRSWYQILKSIIRQFLTSWLKCRPPDQYYWTDLTSWTNTISTSWSKIRSPEKVEFQYHEIRPPDPESYKLPFDKSN